MSKPEAILPALPSTPLPRLSTVQPPPSTPPAPLSTVPPLPSTPQPRLSTAPLLPLTLLLLQAILQLLQATPPRPQVTPQHLPSMTAMRRKRTRRVSRRERRSKLIALSEYYDHKMKMKKNFQLILLFNLVDTHFN